MDVEPDMVTQMVWEESFDSLNRSVSWRKTRWLAIGSLTSLFGNSNPICAKFSFRPASAME